MATDIIRVPFENESLPALVGGGYYLLHDGPPRKDGAVVQRGVALLVQHLVQRVHAQHRARHLRGLDRRGRHAGKKRRGGDVVVVITSIWLRCDGRKGTIRKSKAMALPSGDCAREASRLVTRDDPRGGVFVLAGASGLPGSH